MVTFDTVLLNVEVNQRLKRKCVNRRSELEVHADMSKLDVDLELRAIQEGKEKNGDLSFIKSRGLPDPPKTSNIFE